MEGPMSIKFDPSNLVHCKIPQDTPRTLIMKERDDNYLMTNV
jgi:hypothetical protein